MQDPERYHERMEANHVTARKCALSSPDLVVPLLGYKIYTLQAIRLRKMQFVIRL